MQFKTDTFANSVDSDGMAHNELTPASVLVLALLLKNIDVLG